MGELLGRFYDQWPAVVLGIVATALVTYHLVSYHFHKKTYDKDIKEVKERFGKGDDKFDAMAKSIQCVDGKVSNLTGKIDTVIDFINGGSKKTKEE